MAEFFHMGGYAFYVWASYGIAAVVMAVNVVLPLMRRRALLDGLRRRVRAKGRQPA